MLCGLLWFMGHVLRKYCTVAVSSYEKGLVWAVFLLPCLVKNAHMHASLAGKLEANLTIVLQCQTLTTFKNTAWLRCADKPISWESTMYYARRIQVMVFEYPYLTSRIFLTYFCLFSTSCVRVINSQCSFQNEAQFFSEVQPQNAFPNLKSITVNFIWRPQSQSIAS